MIALDIVKSYNSGSGIVPIDTIIPDGLDYRVLHKSLVGKGTFGKSLDEAVEEVKALGYEPNYGDNNGWNAELYIGGVRTVFFNPYILCH